MIKRIGESILVNKKDIEHLNKNLDENNSVCNKDINNLNKTFINFRMNFLDQNNQFQIQSESIRNQSLLLEDTKAQLKNSTEILIKEINELKLNQSNYIQEFNNRLNQTKYDQNQKIQQTSEQISNLNKMR